MASTDEGHTIPKPRVLFRFDYGITLLTVRHAGGTSFCDSIGHVQVDGNYVELWQPQAMSVKALEISRAIVGKGAGALGGFGLFGVELFEMHLFGKPEALEKRAALASRWRWRDTVPLGCMPNEPRA